MRKLIRTIILIALGIILIPAIYALGLTALGTILGIIANPRVMLILLAGLAIISFPGFIITWIIKR